MTVYESTIGEAELRISILRLVATRHGHTNDKDSLKWAEGMQYVERLPPPSGSFEPLYVFTEKGLELTDTIMASGGARVWIDGTGSFEERD